MSMRRNPTAPVRSTGRSSRSTTNCSTRVRDTLRARLASLASTSSELAQQRTSLVVADATRDQVVAIDPNSRDVRAVPSSLLPRSALAVLLGLVLGLAVAVLLETLRPRLADARAVSRLLGVPLLSAHGHEGTRLARMAALAARRQGVETVVVMPLEQRDDLAARQLVATLAAVDEVLAPATVGPRVRLKVGVAAGAIGAAVPHAAADTPTNGHASGAGRAVRFTGLSGLARQDEERAGVLLVVSGAPLHTSYDALTTLTTAMRWPVIGIVDIPRKRARAEDAS